MNKYKYVLFVYTPSWKLHEKDALKYNYDIVKHIMYIHIWHISITKEGKGVTILLSKVDSSMIA